MNIDDTFWLYKPSILFETSKLNLFFPTQDMTDIERLNSVLRFAIYLTLIIYIFKRDYRIIYLILFTGTLTIFINYYSKIGSEKLNRVNNIFDKFEFKNGNLYFKKKETIKNTENNMLDYKNSTLKCTQPTNNNPFMNRSTFDTEYPDSSSCKYSSTEKDYTNWKNISDSTNQNETISDIIEDKFNLNLYKDVDDIFNRKNSQRQYYTVPVSTLPNKQTDFANWLYNVPKTCKENNGMQCNSNNANIVNAGLENLQLRYK